MKITILAVGKIKEAYFRDAVSEYSKRLSKYCSLEIIEVADEKTPERAGERQQEQIREKEADRLLRHIKEDAYICPLVIEGKRFTSASFAQRIERLGIQGKSHIIFIIGGSLGLHDKVLQRADEKLSFSDMTFPHQLMRVILLEQIYRACRINANEPYHK